MANIPLNLILSMKDEVSGVASKVTGAVGGIAKAGLAIGGVAAAGVLALGGAVVKLGLDAAALEPAKNTFDNLSTSIGSTSDALMTDLRAATRGMVSDADLVAAGNQLMAMGLAESADEASDLTEMATQLGAAMGGEATSSIENFSLMLANQSIPRLDSFGISSGQVRTRIEELIDTGQAADREEAFKLAVLEIGKDTMAKVGDQSETLAGDMARMEASFANTKNQIGEAFVPVMASVADAVLPAISGALEAVIPFAQSFGVWLGENIPLAIEAIKPVAEAVFGWIQENVVPILQTAVAWVQDNWPAIQDVIVTVLQAAWDQLAFVFGWIVDNVIPIWAEVISWLVENWPQIQTTIEQVLQGAWAFMQEVWAWIAGNVVPLLQEAVDWVVTNWPLIQAAIVEAAEEFWATLQEVWKWIEENVIPLLEEARDWIVDNWGKIAGLLIAPFRAFWLFAKDDAWPWIEENIIPTLQKVFDWVSDTWTKVEGKLTAPIEKAKTFIGGLLADIKGLFDSFKLPSIKLPHFKVEWKAIGFGVSVPKVSIDWFAQGLDAVFNSPTIIGVGEAGAERVTVTPLNGRGGSKGGDSMSLTYIDQRPNGGAPDLMAVARGLEWRKRMGVRV